MNDFFSRLPADNGAGRRLLYGGKLYLLPAMPERPGGRGPRVE